MTWQLQQAKQHFSEVVRLAQTQGEQIVTKHGRPAVVVVDFEEYRRARRPDHDVLLGGPRLADETWQIAFGDHLRREQAEADASRHVPFSDSDH